MRRALAAALMLTIGAVAGSAVAADSAPASAAATDAGSPPASPFRYDDDPTVYANALRDEPYAELKYIPLGSQDYLSFGADLRERVEASDVGLLGFRDPDPDAYDLHRLLVFADLQLGPDLRGFIQLGDEEEVGRTPGPAPTDVDQLDLSQAFVDASANLAGGRATLRLGRAEMSFDDGAIIGLRDGPNVRQVWDGARLTYVAGPWRWDAFAVAPVSVQPGVFDDRPLHDQSIEGVHLTVAPAGNLAADAFYYHNLNPQVSLYGASGEERTDTFGLRLRGSRGALDGSVGGIGQTGDADGREVRAFALHGDVGWRFANLPWAPHVTLRGDVLSGGDPKGAHIATFNALYPNVAYSTEATIEAPANLIQSGLVASADPLRTVILAYTLEGLWRYSTRDAFYAAPLFPLVRPTASNDAYSGLEQQIEASWRLSAFVTLKAAYVHFSAGDFIRRGGGHDEDFGMTSISFRL
jgi:hypothetical protein